MTLRLILTRHAKSTWDDPLMEDRDRPLNKRGRASAKALGQWLADKDFVPDEVLVSSAERTRETWKRIAKGFAEKPKASYLDQLYGAEPDQMLGLLRTATGRSVMIVGHNPGAAFFAQGIVHRAPADSRFERFPTGATAVIDFDVTSWDQLVWRTGHVADFVVPRELLPKD